MRWKLKDPGNWPVKYNQLDLVIGHPGVVYEDAGDDSSEDAGQVFVQPPKATLVNPKLPHLNSKIVVDTSKPIKLSRSVVVMPTLPRARSIGMYYVSIATLSTLTTELRGRWH
jgi:hypothetical protein